MEGGDALASPLSNGKPFLLFRGAKEEILILHSKIKYRSCNTPTRRHRDISQTKLRTSVLLRQRAMRLVLAFAICKSRGARARVLRYRDPCVLSLFFADSHLVVLRNSILESGGEKRGRKREGGDRWKRRDVERR